MQGNAPSRVISWWLAKPGTEKSARTLVYHVSKYRTGHGWPLGGHPPADFCGKAEIRPLSLRDYTMGRDPLSGRKFAPNLSRNKKRCVQKSNAPCTTVRCVYTDCVFTFSTTPCRKASWFPGRDPAQPHRSPAQIRCRPGTRPGWQKWLCSGWYPR